MVFILYIYGDTGDDDDGGSSCESGNFDGGYGKGVSGDDDGIGGCDT